MKINGKFILFTVILVAITTLCKFFFGPQLSWSGFSPVIAIALFSGFIIRKKDYSFLLPLLALLLSDAIIQVLYNLGEFPYAGFYQGQWKNYLILMLSTLMGWSLKGKDYGRLAIGAVAAPTVFFLVSNFNVWLNSEVVYAKSFSGLMSCYAAGLPFYKNALIATVVFLPVILFAYNRLTQHKNELVLA